MSGSTRVLVVRGHQANPWELRPWELLGERFDVSYLRTSRTWFDTSTIALEPRPARALRDVLPGGRTGDTMVRVPGDRYVRPAKAFRDADIVHAQELAYWYSMQAARLKEKLGYRLVLTVWETLPFRDAYRNVRTRRYRREVLAATDLFLATTERAAACLEVEGADPTRIRICPPGIDTQRFIPTTVASEEPPLVLSAGRLVWEKGHQDLLRAMALLERRGLEPPRAIIVGNGPDEARLRRYADELGIGNRVELRAFVPYEDMPGLYAQASCLVLLSLATWSWEEQFGMVLAEALAAGLPIVAASSGAIPEVAGPSARYVAPGDYVALADVLAELTPAPHRVADPERVERFSAASAALRLVAAYDELNG
jgi:glycosyltransferase involved in cell wall biosynthesis